ncbi:FUSC family protein [Paenibacillus pinistramenti]|uniref:FUSC family protein n=1 Tax=Paenibacillus pinistramenti TaxID=1768003 RepID=UPI0011091A8D|nr:aromatic acid exporter family protein [Paenibacillus pinistramenti]
MKRAIGLRNIKTGISICICVILAYLFHFDSPFYAAIATIISMENSITNSFTAGRDRVIGTLIGAVTGTCFAFVQPGNPLLCALGVIIIIYTLNTLQRKKSISIGCIVFLAVMLNLGSGESPWAYGYHRIMDTVAGIAVAVGVNYLIFPPRLKEKLEQKRILFAEHMANAFRKLAERGQSVDLPSLRKELISLDQAFDLWNNEFHPRRQRGADMEQQVEKLASYRHIYEHLVILQRLKEEFDADPDRSPDSTAVYHYHLKWIYNELRAQGLPVPEQKSLKLQ